MREEAKNIIDPNEAQPGLNTVVLSKEQFREFHTFLNIIKTHFDDLCIIDGTFRARSNDRSFIVETGFRYFQNCDFSIADINLLSRMIAVLYKNTDITVTFTEESIIFADGCQSVEVAKANTQFIDNAFYTYEEMYGIFFECINPDSPLIKETKSKNVVKNISKVAQNLNTTAIKFRHNENDLNKGHIIISMQGGSPEYTVKLDEDFITPMIENYSFSVTSFPFIFNQAEMVFNYYFDIDRPIIYAIYNTSVDGLFINIYSRTSLIEEDELTKAFLG